jgi:glycine cleavage system H protein
MINVDPRALRYATTHEWAWLDGDICTVGISAFASEQVGDLTYLELPKVGTLVGAERSMGVIESVKSTNDFYAPVSGEVVEVNATLIENLDLVKTDPFGGAWMVKIKVAPGSTLDHLLTYDQYQKQIQSAGH